MIAAGGAYNLAPATLLEVSLMLLLTQQQCELS